MNLIALPSSKEAKSIAAVFVDCGYSEAALIERLGRSAPPTGDDLQIMLHLTAEATTTNTLIRLFLMGQELAADIVQSALPESFRTLCERFGLLQQSGNQYRASIAIVPVGEFLIASDAFQLLATEQASEFVLPASTHSANFLRKLILPGDAVDALDLGAGCGIHALFLSKQSEQVVASDISERAIRYIEFNALLNDRDNITAVRSDRFAGLDGKKFDHIVSNPPFVPGPGGEYTYRDSQLELDEFCSKLAAEAADHLKPGGLFQMLCEWVEIQGEQWSERLAGWFEDAGCDSWILHSLPVIPANYVAKRLTDIGNSDNDIGQAFDKWVKYLTDRHVVAIHPGMVVIRKRQGNNWFHVHDFASDVEDGAGAAVASAISACDCIYEFTDQQLLDSVVILSPQLRLEQSFERAENAWAPGQSVLSLSGGLPLVAEVDMAVLAFLNQLDGNRTIRDCAAKFSDAANAEASKVEADFLPIIRMFMGRGFIIQPAA